MPTPATNLPPLGEVLRNARKAAGLTQAELADLLGVHQSMVSRVEVCGHLSADLYARIMTACGVPSSEWGDSLAIAADVAA